MISNFKVTITDSKGISVPNTGAFTMENTGGVIMVGLGIATVILVFLCALSIILTHHKAHRVVSQDRNSMKLRSSKSMFIGFFAITLVTMSAIFAFVNSETEPHQVSAASSDALAIKTEDIILDITREGKTAYSSVANKITVNSGTSNGYTLGVYASDVDIVSTDDKEKVITSLPDASQSTTLSENTWGVSLVSPEDETSKVWHTMPTSQNKMLTIKSSFNTTPENDATTVYYGALVNDELPSGNYAGPTINYIAIANISSNINVQWEDLYEPGTGYSVSLNPDTGAFAYTITPHCSTLDCINGDAVIPITTYTGTVPSELLDRVIQLYHQIDFSKSGGEDCFNWFSLFYYFANPSETYDTELYIEEADANSDGVITYLEYANYIIEVVLPDLLNYEYL